MFFKKERVHDKAHLEFIRLLPCAKCGTYPCDPHHILSRGAGGGDDSVIPVCRTHHTISHSKGQKTFWGSSGFEKAIELAKQLYENSENHEECVKLIASFRNRV